MLCILNTCTTHLIVHIMSICAGTLSLPGVGGVYQGLVSQCLGEGWSLVLRKSHPLGKVGISPIGSPKHWHYIRGIGGAH